MIAGFAALAPQVAADEDIAATWQIDFVDAIMEEPVTDTVVNAKVGGAPFYLGDIDAVVRIPLCNRHTADAAANVALTLASTDSVFTQIRQLAPANVGAPNSATTGTQGIAAGACANFDFRVNLSATGSIGRHPMTFTVSYERPAATTGAPALTSIPFDVYVSSIFDPIGTDALLDKHDLPRLLETTAGGNGFFLAARNWQPAMMAITNFGGAIKDTTITLGTFGAAGVAATEGKTAAVDPATAGGGLVDNMWRLDVTGTPNPGVYDVAFSSVYKRDLDTSTERTITEQGTSTKFVIDYTPILLAELPAAVTMQQGDFSTFNVRFRNAGNVPLNDLFAEPAADGPAGDFFFAGTSHYENDDATQQRRASLGDLAVGGVSGDVAVTVSHVLLLPGGVHRIAFRWNGWLFDTGATEVASNWYRVGGFMTDADAAPKTPEVGRLFRDVNENGIFDAGDGLVPGEWPGAFVEVAAHDPAPSVFATTGALTTADVTSIPVAVTLANSERFAWLETTPRLKVGPGTPFLAPGNSSQTSLLPTVGPFTIGAVGAGDATKVATFITDLNVAWWKTNSVDPGSFDATVLFSATNADTGARTSDAPLVFKVELVGFGPNVLPSVSSNEPILPGKTFKLTMTLQNTGDDVARNIEATLTVPTRTTAVLDNFFAAHRNVSLRMTDFGAGTYQDMVMAEALAERALSSPGGRIVVVTVERLEPGESTTVVFELVADPNIVPGATYPEMVGVKFADSQAARTFTKGPYVFILTAGGDAVKAIVVGGVTAETGGLLSSPGPGVMLVAFGSIGVAAIALRRRK